MAKKKGFSCSQLDVFAPTESLKNENGDRHGTCCGVFLTIIVVAIMIAYTANELLADGRINSFRVHAHTSIITDYDGSDQEHNLIDQRTEIMFGLYDTVLQTFVPEDPRYFSYQAVRKTSIGTEI